MKLSLIVPCYNEENNVEAFYDLVKQTFDPKSIDYEVIFINDGSQDGTMKALRSIYQRKDGKVSVIGFSRNFGKEAAIIAGLRRAKGEYTTIIDADLQQRPEVVEKMVDYLEENEECDCVAAYQEIRKEGRVLRGMKKMFYRIINHISDTKFVADASDFRTMRRNMVDAVLSLPEYHRFSKGIFAWVGFETYYMPYVAQERNAGESKWSFMKLFRYAIEGFVAFSTSPLKFATYLGGVTSFCAVIYLFVVLIQKLFFGISVPGYPTIIVLILLIGGIQLSILGILGEYLAKTYIQGKNRPIYIEKEKLEYEDDNE